MALADDTSPGAADAISLYVARSMPTLCSPSGLLHTAPPSALPDLAAAFRKEIAAEPRITPAATDRSRVEPPLPPPPPCLVGTLRQPVAQRDEGGGEGDADADAEDDAGPPRTPAHALPPQFDDNEQAAIAAHQAALRRWHEARAAALRGVQTPGVCTLSLFSSPSVLSFFRLNPRLPFSPLRPGRLHLARHPGRLHRGGDRLAGSVLPLLVHRLLPRPGRARLCHPAAAPDAAPTARRSAPAVCARLLRARAGERSLHS